MTTHSKTQGIAYTDCFHSFMQKATVLEFLEPMQDPVPPTHLRADVDAHVLPIHHHYSFYI